VSRFLKHHTIMLFQKSQSALKISLEKHTDEQLSALERQFRRDNEWDAAQACADILLQRRNRPTLAKDEYSSKTGFMDEDFIYWK
jgi:hypothetical protein